jgi:hypothetical protein
MPDPNMSPARMMAWLNIASTNISSSKRLDEALLALFT